MNTPRKLNVAAMMHRGMPAVDGFYWARWPDQEPVVVEVIDHIMYLPGDDRIRETVQTDYVFWGPIKPPDEMTVHFEQLTK